jgi:hypothetical protein
MMDCSADAVWAIVAAIRRIELAQLKSYFRPEFKKR